MTNETADLFKEPCGRKPECLNAGEDCSAEGEKNREGGCFEALPGTEEMVREVTCGNDKCEHYNPEYADHCLANFGEDAPPVSVCCENFILAAAGVVDASDSIPTVPETVTAGGNKTFIRPLPCELLPGELEEHGAEMARLISIWTKAKVDKTLYDRAAKKLIDDTEEKYIKIALLVTAGTEERDVPCYWQYDKEHGVKRLIRCDTYGIVEECNMELLDYEQDPAFQGEQSVAAVEEAFGTTEVREGAQEEAGATEEGETAETEEIQASEAVKPSEGNSGSRSVEELCGAFARCGKAADECTRDLGREKQHQCFVKKVVA